jgi:glycosyltransferase involved in cell wall biosynthesis
MVLIEAQESALPVVSFDCPYGPSDIIHHGKNGYLIPFTDDEAFISAVDNLINSPALREQMGHNAKLQSSKYNKATIIRRWKDFFSSNENTTRRRI